MVDVFSVLVVHLYSHVIVWIRMDSIYTYTLVGQAVERERGRERAGTKIS